MIKLLIFSAFTLLILSSPLSHADVVINEVMYNPFPCSDFDCEWIEVYNTGNESVNITSWTFQGKYLTGIINASEYVVFADELVDGSDNDTDSFEAYWGDNTIVWGDYINENYSAYDIDAMPQLKDKDIIYLNHSNGTLMDFVFLNSSIGANNDGNTLQLVNKSWCAGMPTPGSRNTCESLPLLMKFDLWLQVQTTFFVDGIENDDLFNITNLDYYSGQPYIDVIVDFNITVNGTLVFNSSFTKSLKQKSTSNTGKWQPAEGSYVLCGNIVNSTFNDTNISNNLICKNITVVENPVTLISYPSQAKFGYYNLAFIKFNTSYYEHNRTRFLIYGKSRKIVADPEWNKIKSYAECQGDTAIEINTSANQTYFLSIPFFIYPNCDNDYSNGDYELALRVCNSRKTGFEKYLEYIFSLEVSGNNALLCPSDSSCSHGGGKVSAPPDCEGTGLSSYEIISYPGKVSIMEEFETILRLENNDSQPKEISVYSYVYEGKKILSEGFDGNKWKGGWTANKREIHLAGNSSVIITLKNRIKENISTGNYKFRAKIKEDGKTRNLDEYIEVVEAAMNEINKEEFEILSFDTKVRAGEEFETKIKINNFNNITGNYSVYSYVHNRSKLLSEGFNGKKWGRTWTSNRKTVSVEGNFSLVVSLKNRIRADAKEGRYTFKIRINEESKKQDLVREIEIIEAADALNTTNMIGRDKVSNNSEQTSNQMTGNFLKRSNGFPFKSSHFLFTFLRIFF